MFCRLENFTLLAKAPDGNRFFTVGVEIAEPAPADLELGKADGCPAGKAHPYQHQI